MASRHNIGNRRKTGLGEVSRNEKARLIPLHHKKWNVVQSGYCTVSLLDPAGLLGLLHTLVL